MFADLQKKVKNVFTQNISVEKLTLSIALGIMGGLWPIPGTSTFACLFLALFVSVNVPAMTLINLVVTPIEIAMIPVFVWIGNTLRATFLNVDENDDSVQISNLISELQENLFDGIMKFGSVLMTAIVAWTICLPFGVTLFYVLLKPIVGWLMSFYAASGKENLDNLDNLDNPDKKGNNKESGKNK